MKTAGMVSNPTVTPEPEGSPEGEVVELDDIGGVLDAYRQVTRQIADLTVAREELRRRIEGKLGEAETGTFRGQPVVEWPHIKQRRLSTKHVAAKFGEANLDDCYVYSDQRRFSFHDDET